MPRLQLLDLPTELLLSILKWVESESLYRLALLSRRLNSIALRVYFRRQELDPDSNSIEFTLGTKDVLSALQIALFIQSLDHIHCSIPHYTSQPSITPFLRHIKRLERFISRLTSVKKATLHLASHEGNWCIKLKTVDELCAWSLHVGDLLNCIVKRGCQCLSIADGSVAEPTRRGFINRVRHLGPLHFKRVPVMARFPSDQSQITTLVIRSATFLASPWIDWIIAALERVTRLGVGMTRGNAHAWSEVLPRIAAAAPHLALLSLSQVPESLEFTILSALDQFPHLTSLDIQSQRQQSLDSTPENTPHLPSPSLHSIGFLSAGPELVEHFLAPMNALPELYGLRVECGGHTDLRLSTLLTFLARITPKLNAHPQMPYLNMEINMCAWSTDADLSLGIPPELAAREDIAAGCARVTGLTLHLNVTGGYFTHAEAVVQLAAFFSQTALLSLHTRRVTPSMSAVAQLVQALKQTKVAEIVLNDRRRILCANPTWHTSWSL
ncbi:hypothetical protein C8R45DRAFT_1044020 [Mycena sanguinolenta]|nr:hypothetical protein C8R45DRAFT_1044020 [Mycena sanguinolenta]